MIVTVPATVILKPIGYEYKDNQEESTGLFIRYAAKITLSVTVAESRKGNINVPLLRVLYEDVSTSQRDSKVSLLRVLYEDVSTSQRDSKVSFKQILIHLRIILQKNSAKMFLKRN